MTAIKQNLYPPNTRPSLYSLSMKLKSSPIKESEYNKLPIYEYTPNEPFDVDDLPPKGQQFDDGTIGRVYMMLSAKFTTKRVISKLTGFYCDGYFNVALLRREEPALDSEGQVLLYMPKNSSEPVPLIGGKPYDGSLRIRSHIVNVCDEITKMPGFDKYTAAISEGKGWQYMKPTELGSLVARESSKKRPADDDNNQTPAKKGYAAKAGNVNNEVKGGPEERWCEDRVRLV